MSKIYVRVEDGEVVERSTRPRVDNISSAHLLSDADLAKHGWLPLEREKATLESDEVRSDREIVVEEGRRVVERETKRRLTAEELAERRLQQRRDALQEIVSPDELLLLVLDKLSAERKAEIETAAESILNPVVRRNNNEFTDRP